MMVYNKSASALRAGQEKVVMKKWESATTILTVGRMLSVTLNFHVNAKRAGKVTTVKHPFVIGIALPWEKTGSA